MKLCEVIDIIMDLQEEHGPLGVFFKTKDGELHAVRDVGAFIIPGEPTPLELLDEGDIESSKDLLLALYYFNIFGNATDDVGVNYMRNPIDFIDYENDGDFEGIVMRSYIES